MRPKRIILLQHDVNTPSNHLIEVLALHRLVGIKLHIRSSHDLPSKKLVNSATGIVLLDAPRTERNPALIDTEIEFFKNLILSNTPILSLGTSTELTGLAFGSKISKKAFRLGWFPITTTPINQELFEIVPKKIFVCGGTSVYPPDKADILFESSEKGVSAFVHLNVMSLNFISCLNHTTYRRILKAAKHTAHRASSNVQTLEELEFHGRNLKNYLYQMKTISEYWIKIFTL